MFKFINSRNTIVKILLISVVFCLLCITFFIINHKWSHNKLYVVFTIDTENNYNNNINRFEGDFSKYGIKENCGINYILDTFDKYGAKAVFFVNIYEHERFGKDYMPNLLKRIDSKGHEVGLHSHPTPVGYEPSFYNTVLSNESLDKQIKILKYGRDYIEKVLGKTPISFRGGGYQCNDWTFQALERVGFKIDSSLYYGKISRNKVTFPYQNQTFKINSMTEFPVIAVFNGKQWQKLDINALDNSNIIKSLEYMRKSGNFAVVQIMFHSFSFMDLQPRELQDKKFLYKDGPYYIYGENKEAKKHLESVLDYITKSPDYEIITFRDFDKLNIKLPEIVDDSIIYLKNKPLAMHANNIEVSHKDNTIFLKNNLKGKNLLYRWKIYPTFGNGKIYMSEWSKGNSFSITMPDNINQEYRILAMIRNKKGKSVLASHCVYFKNGKIAGIWYR